MIRRYSFAAVLATSLMFAPTVAAAQITTFTSFSAWQTAQTGAQIGVDTFDDLAFEVIPAPLARSAGALNYVGSVVGGTGMVFYPAGTLTDRWLSPNFSEASMVFSGFSSGVNAIGGEFFASNIIGAFLSADIQVSWVTSAGSGSTTLTAPTTSSFFGLITTGTLTSLTVSAVQPVTDQFFRWATVNNLRLGRPTVVPEPSTFALVATGLVALVVRQRRRRA